MALSIGPGLDEWCKAHGATPLDSESYPWGDLPVSCLPILIGNDQGQTVRTLVGYDQLTNTILAPGPGVVIVQKPSRPVTNAIMYDSTSAADIPPSAQYVAGYVDGAFRWSAEDFARFPVYRRITINYTTGKMGDHYADVLDVEAGDATPAQAGQWLHDWATGATPDVAPVIYCNVSTKPEVDAAAQGVAYRWWAADWTGGPHLLPGSIATQYADPNYGSGGHYDVSLLSPDWQ